MGAGGSSSSQGGIKQPLIAPSGDIGCVRGTSPQDVRLRSIDGESFVIAKDFASSWDYVMVLPSNAADEQVGHLHDYTSNLIRHGLELYCYQSQTGEYIVLIRAPIEVLRFFADDSNYRLLLDENVLEALARRGDKERNIAPIEIPHMEDVVRYRPYELIFGKYSSNVTEDLYARPAGAGDPFGDIVRLKLVARIIEARPPGGGENLKMRRYVNCGRMLACFPLHDRAKLRALEHVWLDHLTFPWRQPFHSISNYFGEKLGLYYLWMGHYTKWLLMPCILGVPLEIAIVAGVAGVGFDAPYLPFYSIFIAVWGIVMLEFWKRKEKRTALEWGTYDYEKTEQDRADFRGDKIRSFVNGKEIFYFPTPTRNWYIFHSSLAIIGLAAVVIGVVASIYLIRNALVDDGVSLTNAQTFASVSNAIEIQVANIAYSYLAYALNDRENHRTETQYEDALITKTFVFQFINSYASFFYVAFFAEVYEPGGCGVYGCMYSLSINLGIIFAIRLVLSNLFDFFLPYLSHKLFGKKHGLCRAQYEWVVACCACCYCYCCCPSSASTSTSSSNIGNGGGSSSSSSSSSSIGSDRINNVAGAHDDDVQVKIDAIPVNQLPPAAVPTATAATAASATTSASASSPQKKLNHNDNDKRPRPEMEFALKDFDTSRKVIEDYGEVAIQFGYQVLWVSALPAASAFAFFSNLVTVRGNAWKLIHMHRRPVPLCGEDIGRYQDILTILAGAAVITNAGMTVFTMTVLDAYSAVTRFWIFVAFQWVCFLVQSVVMAVIPDVPEEIDFHMQRAEYLTSKIIDKVADDEPEEIFGGLGDGSAVLSVNTSYPTLPYAFGSSKKQGGYMAIE